MLARCLNEKSPARRRGTGMHTILTMTHHYTRSKIRRHSVEGVHGSIAGQSYSNEIAGIVGEKLVFAFTHMNYVRNPGAANVSAVNCGQEQVDHHAGFNDFSTAATDNRIEFRLAK